MLDHRLIVKNNYICRFMVIGTDIIKARTRTNTPILAFQFKNTNTRLFIRSPGWSSETIAAIFSRALRARMTGKPVLEVDNGDI